MNDPLAMIITGLIVGPFGHGGNMYQEEKLHYEDLDNNEKKLVEQISNELLTLTEQREATIDKNLLSRRVIQVLENDLNVAVKMWLGNGDAVLFW